AGWKQELGAAGARRVGAGEAPGRREPGGEPRGPPAWPGKETEGRARAVAWEREVPPRAWGWAPEEVLAGAPAARTRAPAAPKPAARGYRSTAGPALVEAQA